MSARLRTRVHRRDMTRADIDAVLAIEGTAYSFPWSRANFIDSLLSGYLAEVLVDDDGRPIAYSVAMVGVEEMHLLNLTVAPAHQGRGHASTLLDALLDHCGRVGAAMLWLEVRAGNARARAIYQHRGFVEVGRRRGYYPAGPGQREDAIVMSLRPGPKARDAVD